MKIGEKIKKARNEKGLSMEQLSEKIGYCGRSSINRLESGERSPSIEVLEKIAEALGLELEINFKKKA